MEKIKTIKYGDSFLELFINTALNKNVRGFTAFWKVKDENGHSVSGLMVTDEGGEARVFKSPEEAEREADKLITAG